MMSSVMLSAAARKIAGGWGPRSFRYFRHTSQENRPVFGYNGSVKILNKKLAVAGYANYSDRSNLSWKRPECPPRIWRVIEGKKKSKDGKMPRFTIQDVPEDRKEDVIEFMIKYLLNEEALFLFFGIAKDPLALEDLRNYLRNKMRQGMSIVALTENSEPGTKSAIAGANILTVLTTHDKDKSLRLEQLKSKGLKEVFGIIFALEDQVDVLGKYGVDKYLGSVGLACHPSFRGNGVAQEILNVREDIGRSYQIHVAEATFTMKGSQISGTRAGFEIQLEKEYSEILDSEGNPVFPGEAGKFIQVMTKKLY